MANLWVVQLMMLNIVFEVLMLGRRNYFSMGL